MTRTSLAMVLLLTACGGGAASATAHEALVIAARGLKTVETTVGEAQARERAAIAVERPTQSEARRRLSPYWRVEEADRGIRALMFATEKGLEIHGAEGFAVIAPCFVELLARLREALTVLVELGVEVAVPPEIDTALQLLAGYSGTCGGE